MSQYERISNYLDKHGSLTTMEAFTALRITKLSTRVGEMNQSGKYKIVGEWETHKSADGDVSRYMRYRKVCNA
ncbi:MAG: hypothetical protein J6Y20_10040 [Lachnospiraceae bacterium]|nr:hypothetical protein [Lachnospiraceae bacterium]MBP5462453.1 hypothetical protein [Lachnospiraceae bacterium]